MHLYLQKSRAYTDDSVHVYRLSREDFPHISIGNPKTKSLAHLKPESAQIRSERSAVFLCLQLQKMYCLLTKYLLILHSLSKQKLYPIALAKLRKTKQNFCWLSAGRLLVAFLGECFSKSILNLLFFVATLIFMKGKTAYVTFEEFKWGEKVI